MPAKFEALVALGCRERVAEICFRPKYDLTLAINVRRVYIAVSVRLSEFNCERTGHSKKLFRFTV